MSDEKVLGEMIRQARKNKELSQEKVAELTGMTPQTISNIERGVNSANFSSVMKILRAVGIPMQNFVPTPDAEDDEKTRQELIQKIVMILQTMNQSGLAVVLEQSRIIQGHFKK